ncbi:MAG: hypothetical protein IJD38_06740 [Clostridia bacterium]|nr:hypothetical protein [Clostridia bacterium]
MSSSRSTYDSTSHRRTAPATASAEELIARLGVDPATGLSPKEAERRLSASSARSLFVKPPVGLFECLKQITKEPALWMLLAVSVISLFFHRFFLGAACALLTVGNAVLCGFLRLRTDRMEAAMAAYDAPLCRVLRGGRVLRVGGDGLVKGDILLLYPGDIVPADCRLLRATNLVVLERELDAADAARPPRRLSKNASDKVGDGGDYRVSPGNMVYAGGIVEEGSAVALVLAVGSETHLGGLIGTLPSSHRGRKPAVFGKAFRALSTVNLGLFCLLVPLTAIGIFTLGDRYEFLDIFLSAAALAALTLTEVVLTKACYVAALTRRAAARDRDRESTADIRSSAVCQDLIAMTDLILVGTAALHDGLSHPETLRVGEALYLCDRPEADDEARAVAEYFYVYRRAMGGLPAEGDGGDSIPRFISELCDWAEIDTDGLLARVEDLRAEGGCASGIWRSPEGNRRLRLYVTDRIGDAESCELLHDPRGALPLDREGRMTLRHRYTESLKQGFAVSFLITEDHGTRTLRATVTHGPHSDRRAVGCVKALEKSGIRVAAFLRDESEVHLRALSACGLTETVPAERPVPHTPRDPSALRMDRGFRAFSGCDEEHILQCIRDLKAQGRTVGVLSVDSRDLAILAEADIPFVCTPSLYLSAESGAPRLTAGELAEGDVDPDGGADGRISTDRARRLARVLVRRSSSRGGGLTGVRRALLAADSCGEALDRSLRLLLLTQTVRLVMTVIPLCLGLSLAAAPVLLLSGLGLDLLCMLTYAYLPTGDIPSGRRLGDLSLARLWHCHRAEITAAAAGATLPWLAMGLAALLGVRFGGDLLYFGFLCTVGLHAAIFRVDRLPRRDSHVFMTTLALGLVYAGALAAALASGLGLIWAIPVPLAAPGIYLGVRAILRRTLWPKASSEKG